MYPIGDGLSLLRSDYGYFPRAIQLQKISWLKGDDDAMAATSDFHLLTMGEFSRLSRLEKIAYLGLAVKEALRKGKKPYGDNLFRDGPPLPGPEELAS